MIKSGGLGEVSVMKHFLELGFEVYISVSDNSEYDLIVSKDSKLSTVEVKSTNTKSPTGSGWVVQLKKVRSNRNRNVITNFDNTKVDFLAVYIEPENRVLIFEASKISQKTSVVISKA